MSTNKNTLNADLNTTFEKVISPKLEVADPSLDDFYQKHSDLMKKLEDR